MVRFKGAWGGYVKKVIRATKSIAGWVNWVISCYKERGEVRRWAVSGVNVAADTWRHFIPPVLTLKLLSTTHCNNYALQQLCNSTTMQCKLYAQQALCTTRHYAVPPWSTKHCKHYMQCKHYAVLLWATMHCNHCKHYDYATMHHNCFQCDTYSLEMHVLYNLEKITHMYVVKWKIG